MPFHTIDTLEFLVAAAIIGLQSVLIAVLMVRHARKGRLEIALREREHLLRQAAAQNQDLTGRLISAHEAEQTRIARALHDDVSQQLAALSIMLGRLQQQVRRSDSRTSVERTLTTLLERTSMLAQVVRDLSYELHPIALGHSGLVATLKQHCAEVEQQHHIMVDFSPAGDLDSVSPELALCLFRVEQEAVANAVRHARARTIRVELKPTNEGIELGVIDDGTGFVTSERTKTGMGLRCIDQRVRLAGGDVSVESRLGQGTRLVVRIPFDMSRLALAPHVVSGTRPGRDGAQKLSPTATTNVGVPSSGLNT